jgi:hypothetical protein
MDEWPVGALRLLSEAPAYRSRGVSFFLPDSEMTAAIANDRGGSSGFQVVAERPVGIGMPKGLELVRDADLMAEVSDAASGGWEGVVPCGQHWSLVASEEGMTDRAFELAVSQFMDTFCVHQNPNPEAKAKMKKVYRSDSGGPADRLTLAAVMALESLARDEAADPNTRLFADLYALHILACDPEFADVVRSAPISLAVADALERWKVVDPWTFMDVSMAHDMLAVAGYPFKLPDYDPLWLKKVGSKNHTPTQMSIASPPDSPSSSAFSRASTVAL